VKSNRIQRDVHLGHSLAVSLLLWLIMGQAIAEPISQDELWNTLRGGGNVLLIRHAQTIPGFGDPPGFQLNDCSSQRYLSDDGRAQARRMGDRVRTERVPIGPVLSSEWCRCYETAQMAFGTYRMWPPLNSFFKDYSTRDEQTQAVLKQIESFAEEGNLVLVTHQVNITALTGKAVSQGEAVVVRHDPQRGFQVLGNIRFE
jgi:broad specificity phosphatase PhoE